MARLVWLTDIHLNFAQPTDLAKLLEQIENAAPDCVLIGGDIGESRNVVDFLKQLANHWQTPINFVLGNHDYYHGSIAEVREQMDQLCQSFPHLTYLSHSEPVALAEGTALIGHDGWGDARIGDYENSPIMLNDYRLIRELAACRHDERRSKLMALGDEAAHHIRHVLPIALRDHDHVYLLTHVPPYREACLYDQQVADDDWAPHFTCQAVGSAISEIMQQYADQHLTVLCGHSHHQAEFQALPNLRVRTGGATYGQPAIEALFEVG